MKLNLQSILGIAAMCAAGVFSSAASPVNYDFTQVSSGTTPAGTPPWAQASFTDVGMPADAVQLTLSAGNLAGSTYLSCWYFNIDSLLDPTALNFTAAGSTGAFTGPTISTGANAFKAGPDGKFDILFTFNSTGDDSTRFTSGDSMTFTISGISGLTVQDFNQLSTTAGGVSAYTSAAHIESGESAAWVNPTTTQIQNNGDDGPQRTVPDASTTITLLGASLAGVEVLRRKLKSRLTP